MRKCVFYVSEKVIPKPACSATDTNNKIEILLVARGAQWLSGRVLDSRPKRPRVRASPASLLCGP